MKGDGVKPSPGAWSATPILVVALGGNAISRAGDEPSVGAQFERTRATAELLVPIIESGRHRLVITHGNGPQVGNILLRSDLATEAGVLPPLPIDSAVADTQGAMGYMLQQCLSNALWESGIRIPVVTVVTQVIVDEDDPDFADPSKPIGRFYDEAKARALQSEYGWTIKKDKSSGKWRRVVPSPDPKEIVEEDIVRELLEEGVIVIACGGGGVPVVTGEGGSLKGVDAVIDKDLASALLAGAIGAEIFAIVTEVDRVYIDFNGPNEAGLDDVDIDVLRRYQADDQFPSGSMGPKVKAAIGYIERGGGRAIITSPEALEDALEGKAGTHVVRALPATGTQG
ncbi:MAG: carbamate kinase [Actinomycetota bacterium]